MKKNYYHISATGNDFLIVDDRDNGILSNQIVLKTIFEILKINNIDGFISLNTCKGPENFEMHYFNNDGNEVELCGNGLRAISYFADSILNISLNNDDFYNIKTMNGTYQSWPQKEKIKVKMTEIEEVGLIDITDLMPESLNSLYVKVGVPHCVFVVDELKDDYIDILAPKIRSDSRFKNGVNINFIKFIDENTFQIRTFERGVEGETLSCGTGSCASTMLATKLKKEHIWNIKTKCGKLRIGFFEKYFELEGPVKFEKIFKL